MAENHQKIKDWIAQGEGTFLEFKLQLTNPLKIARTLCAFANGRGGHLLIGITDGGQIAGVIDIEAQKKLIAEANRHYCEPSVHLHIKEYTENFLTVLVIQVLQSRLKPHATLQSDGTFRVYVRSGNETVPATKLVEKRLLNEQTEEENYEPRNFDSKELGLLEYLRTHHKITAKQYMTLMNLSYRRARRILIQLTIEGVLLVHDHNKEDYYTLS